MAEIRGNKAHMQLKNSKSTVNYGKSIVLYRNFHLAPAVCTYLYVRTKAIIHKYQNYNLEILEIMHALLERPK